jgi:hypothetical protein
MPQPSSFLLVRAMPGVYSMLVLEYNLLVVF